jgi:antitoxin component YwqK of YwqJK toxin-antitoxin module
MRKWVVHLMIASCFLVTGCTLPLNNTDPDKITSINIIDHNGMSETINSKERLNAYEHTDFLAPQPYQKVMRIYGRQKNGEIRSCITSYHPNGQVKQYLEATNNRACGTYREWYPNGTLKIETCIIGGVADINTQAEQSWLFDGINTAWDENGKLIAEIRYCKGELQGDSLYYHPNGQIWKISSYDKNRPQGTFKIFLENGELFQTLTYQEGEKEGIAERYWDPSHLAYRESYKKGLLMVGHYYNYDGSSISAIEGGSGYRAIFGKQTLQELQQYQNGIQEGCVKVYDEEKNLISLYSIKEGEKEGEEIDYFPFSSQPKLLLTWHRGILQGPVKTWYENGQLESQREMSENQKQGLLTAWYRNGALMLVEEYECDKLLKGEYYRMGEKVPLSQIEKGKGIATLFNPEGNFSRKVYYQDGKPLE